MKMHEKLTISKVFACFLFLLFICLIGVTSETVMAAPKNGVCQASDGNWYYYVDGVIQKGETVQSNVHGWWYINEDGRVDFDYTGFASNQHGLWYCERGQVSFEYEGFAKDGSGNWWYCVESKAQKDLTSIKHGIVNGNDSWWYVKNGKVSFVTTIAENDLGIWYVESGEVLFNYEGFACDTNGTWWYFKKSKAQKDLTTVVRGEVNGKDAWWYVKNGKFTFENAIASNEHGTWFVENGRVAFNHNGFAKDGSNWYYCVENKVQTDLTSVVSGYVNDKYSWWYIEDGKVEFVNAVASNQHGTWYTEDGEVTFTYNGFAEDKDGDWWYCSNSKVQTGVTSIISGYVKGTYSWWYVENGKVTFTNTVASNDYGWWCVEDGEVTFNYNGFATNQYGTWYVVNSKVDFKYEGFAEDDDGNWWYCVNNKVQADSTALVSGKVDGKTGWWYIENGKVTNKTTIASNGNGWWYVENGKINNTYNGIASNQYGTWYVKNGKVSFDYDGFIADGSGNWWYYEDSKLQREMTSVKQGCVNGKTSWWYIERGVVTYKDTVASNDYGWWYVEDGEVTFDFTDLIHAVVNGTDAWYYFKNSQVQTNFCGFVENQHGWWYVVNGKVDFTINSVIYGTVNGQTGNWQVAENSPKYIIYDQVLLANCGHDENRRFRGGVAGDQTGTEWRIINWYSYPWDCILRYDGPRTAEVRALMTQYAQAGAANDHIGYDQSERITFWNQLAANGYNPANITVDCEADCSAGVVAIIKAVGYTLNIQALKDVSQYAYTGNLISTLTAAGFSVHYGSGYTYRSDYLLAGDVLLNIQNHTTICVSSGTSGGQDPGEVPETNEIRYARNGTVQQGSCSDAVKTLQEALNTLGYRDDDGNSLYADGDFGAKTKQAVINFQRNNGLETDGIVGSKTWAKIGKAIDDL